MTSPYDRIRETAPALFANPPGAAFEILTDPADIAAAEAAARERLGGHPHDWSRTGIAFADPYALILRDPVRFPDGTLGTYVRNVSLPGSAAGVVILPLLADRIVLVRHFRHATRDWHLELPRGGGEPGLTPESNARRELVEEIGADISEISPLGVMHPDTGMMNGEVHLFLAHIRSIGTVETQEGITGTQTVSTPELEQLIRDGTITDGFTINAYARAHLHNLLP